MKIKKFYYKSKKNSTVNNNYIFFSFNIIIYNNSNFDEKVTRKFEIKINYETK